MKWMFPWDVHFINSRFFESFMIFVFFLLSGMQVSTCIQKTIYMLSDILVMGVMCCYALRLLRF